MKPMSIAEQTVSQQSPVERQIADLLAKREALLASGKTPQHPDVVVVDDTIAALQKQQRANADAPENQHNTQTKLQENPQYQVLKNEIADASSAAIADQQENAELAAADRQVPKADAANPRRSAPACRQDGRVLRCPEPGSAAPAKAQRCPASGKLGSSRRFQQLGSDWRHLRGRRQRAGPR